MQRSIATVSLSGTLPEKLEAIAAAGFDGVEIFENDLLYYAGSPREIRQRCADLGLAITLFQPFRDFEGCRRDRLARNLERADQAIAMATMFLSEHIGVRAIVAMTESGGTARYLSRFRSSAPIYAFSRHDGARRKMAMIRDVFPIAFDSRGLAPREAARDAMRMLRDRDLLATGDRVVFTSGDHMEQHGATNTLRLLQIGPDGRAEGLGEL